MYLTVQHRRVYGVNRLTYNKPLSVVDMTRPGTEVVQTAPTPGVDWYRLLGMHLSGPGAQPQPYLRWHLEREYVVWANGYRHARLKQVVWYAPGTRCWYAAGLGLPLNAGVRTPGGWSVVGTLTDGSAWGTHPVGVGATVWQALEDLWNYPLMIAWLH